MVTFRQQHVAMLLTYSGISFISGAVNHGFFSGERSLWTAAIGIVLFVAGAWMNHRAEGGTRHTVVRTLLWGSLLSIGLGFFTGGLQHFPDSPTRSAWVVPLGFVISALALYVQLSPEQRRVSRNPWVYGVAASVVVIAASYGSWQWLQQHPELAGGHHHGEPPASGLLAQTVSRTVEVQMAEMQFLPRTIQVAAGETIRFVSHNSGTVDHELVLGTPDEIRAHAKAMQSGAAHAHGGAAVTVAPGATRDLVVTFDRPGAFTMACLIPGHFESGMVGEVQVALATPPPIEATPVAPPPAAKPARHRAHDHSTHKH